MSPSIRGSTPSMSLVIGTYASLAYVHLQLEAWRRHCADMPCLVRDDCSHERDRLSGLCRDYGADFESNTRRRGHVVGDMLVFTRGLAWALARFEKARAPWSISGSQSLSPRKSRESSGPSSFALGGGSATHGLDMSRRSWS